MRLSGGEEFNIVMKLTHSPKLVSIHSGITLHSPMRRKKRDSQTLTNEIQPGE